MRSAAAEDQPREVGQDVDGDKNDAALSYLQAMAGFMGVVDTPKEADPEAEAAAAVAFLEDLWAPSDAEVLDATGNAQHRQTSQPRVHQIAACSLWHIMAKL
jgi:hypothetical protein